MPQVPFSREPINESCPSSKYRMGDWPADLD
jgi:hypothetical protein